MWYQATLYAYDAIGQVRVSTEVRSAPEDQSGEWRSELHATAAFDGTGEPDPRVWLKDALVALIETL